MSFVISRFLLFRRTASSCELSWADQNSTGHDGQPRMGIQQICRSAQRIRRPPGVVTAGCDVGRSSPANAERASCSSKVAAC
jgi:hypothetical protein